MVEVGGHRYHRNKCDLTLSPPDNNNDESDSHSDDHDVPMATGVMPTLCPRPQLKFSKLPVQQINKRTSIYNAITVYVLIVNFQIQCTSSNKEHCRVTTGCHPK